MTTPPARVRRSRPILRGILLALAAAVLLFALWLGHALNDRPSLGGYDALALPPAAAPGGVRVTFAGVSTLLVSDGETALLTDGFFSRPGLFRTLAGRIAPDPDAISAGLARAGIAESPGALAAVFVVHSHYDHAMDAPDVARRTGALLVGSESTANIARGVGFDESRFRLARSGEPMSFGRFRVTMIRARHFPHGMAMGEITQPLVPPASAMDYLEGGSYSVVFEHPDGTILVQGSAGWEGGALAGVRADVAFLGVGGLGTRDRAYMEEYWRETAGAVGARRAIAIHWDDFTRPLSEPLVPMPRLTDDFDASMAFLRERAAASGVDLRLAREGAAVDPFAGLR
jgi:L-ascorbate metabolism protein UlaG (beta-lactamase superfamily)